MTSKWLSRQGAPLKEYPYVANQQKNINKKIKDNNETI